MVSPRQGQPLLTTVTEDERHRTEVVTRQTKWRQVELKSAQVEIPDKDALRRLTPNERRVAEPSVAASDDRWWCAIVEHALDDRRRRYRGLAASALLGS